mgnify:CR=1 FL=1
MTRIEISPHCSLSPRGARIFLLTAAAASLSVALPLTLLGFWPVLPFAGIELAHRIRKNRFSFGRGRPRRGWSRKAEWAMALA